MPSIIHFLSWARGRIPALCVVVAMLLILAAVVPAGAQVAHEDPGKALPSKSMSSNGQISMLLGHTLVYLDNVSSGVQASNFTRAWDAYFQFNLTAVKLENMIWQLNQSDPEYDAISGELNSTNAELAAFIISSNSYNNTRLQYGQAVADSDIVNVSLYRVLINDRYTRTINSYTYISSNISALSPQLKDKNIDTRPMQDSLNNFNNYIEWLNEDYGSLGIGVNGSTLFCGANQSVASIGDDVRLSTYLIDSQGQPINNSSINFYIDNRLLGSNTTNDKGRSFIDYFVPATVEQDNLHIQAEYMPAGGAMPGVYSNPVLLHVNDLYTSISMHLDNDEAYYGDTVAVSGQLSPLYGIYSGGRTISILFGDMPAGATVTDDNGSYEYDLHIAPETLAGTFMINAIYQQSPDDILLGSVSDEASLNITTQNTNMTLSCPVFVNLGDEAAFNGTLFSANGKPVSGANVSMYLDDQILANGTTDDNGTYLISAAIPYNATAGIHEVFTTFNPDIGVSLNGSSSRFAEIRFNDTGKKIDVQGVPLVLFADDRLNLTGTLFSGAGAPITNRSLDIKVAGFNATMAVTDDAGNFNTSIVATSDMLTALSRVTISDGESSSVLYDRQVLLIPFDLWKVVGAFVILAAFISGAFVIVRRPGARGQSRALNSEPDRPDMAASQSLRPDFDINVELSLIKAAMDKNDARTALILIYAAARKAVALTGVEVTDAMTEDSFYDKAAAAFPRVAPPLRYILNSYQSAIDAHRVFSISELEMAVKCLVYINRELTASQEA